jgi:uncharacterized protein (DUF305 family)
MQINIDKRTAVLSGVIIALIAVIITMGVSKTEHRPDHMNQSSTADLSGVDIMFLQMMIPHHQQAVDISKLAVAKSKDDELLALAASIRDGQAEEILLMTQWLKDAGEGLDMGHSMHDQMGGMLDEAELAALQSATGATFDRLWLQGMTGHHDGALHMTQMIEDATNETIKKFGQEIVSMQSSQIKQMKVMLQRIS